jgi:hypothetical protein
MEKAPKPLAHLLMREIITALERILAPLHGFHKAVFFVEVTRHKVRGQKRRDSGLGMFTG